MSSCLLLPRALAYLDISTTAPALARSIGNIWKKNHLAILLLIALAIAPHSSTATKVPLASMSGAATSGACSTDGSSEVQRYLHCCVMRCCMNMYTLPPPRVSWLGVRASKCHVPRPFRTSASRDCQHPHRVHE